ncbi:MAG: hypothetical protein IT199_07185, partial [Solirubrobacterales bacterium]|nr:hypothetical protein [Solirubrobacterales bacterium]
EDRLLAAGVSADLVRQPNYVKANGVLEDIEQFDADFFGMTAREAELTDPQHRLFLECAWEALESAGYDSAQYSGQIGVYGGAGMSSYLLYNLAPNREALAAASDIQLLLGNNKDFVPSRVSYKLNLRGPSVNVNTACSTSLVAVHMACQSLLDYQTDMALAGGVGIQVPQDRGYLYEAGGITSPDGHCRAFAADAEGTVNGSGVGIVVLKRLADALADGDTIHAVILASAINNDGANKVGFTAPSVEGQMQVIAEAQNLAEINAESIGYIEAHGTGTTLGDPIEVRALTQVFRSKTQRRGFCALGSVKSNLGHLDEAAGIAGLIKTVLALKHRQIPPTLHATTPNPRLNLAETPFYLNTTLKEWQSGGLPRRAAVSSFGIGGTNAHLILEEAPQPANQTNSKSRPYQLLLLSVQSESALQQAASNLASHLAAHPEARLEDVA